MRSMKIVVIIFNTIIALYFFLLANFFFWTSVLALFVSAFARQEPLRNPWLLFVNMLFAPFFIYGAVTFFRKTESKYRYGLVVLLIFWIQMQIFRFFFITNKTLENTDFSNFLFFAVSMGVILLTQKLSNKYFSKK